MEHNIVMIPVEALRHHPENPRREIGDVKELAESIRHSGVMQNLTVVPNPADDETWLVVIGNRRLEAAKKAGLTKMPCYISDMDHKEQIATMMAENMQRADLTLVEQAKGVQMMMDLGMDTAEISRRTGIRRDAVERRKAINQYEEEKVKAAVAKGGTLKDFIDLEKVQDEQKRTELLGYIGTNNFRNKLSETINDQKDWNNVRLMAEKLDTFATRIEKSGEVNGREQRMMEVSRRYRPDKKDVDEIEVPKDVKDRRYYYTINSRYPEVVLYKEVSGKEDIDKVNGKSEIIKKAYNEKYNKAEKTWERMKQMRMEFMREGIALHLDEGYLLRELMAMMLENMSDESEKNLKEMLNAENCEKQELTDKLAKEPAYGIACILISWLDQNWKCKPYTQSYNQKYFVFCLKHEKNEKVFKLYEILTRMGYEISDEEIAMLGGTHEVFEKQKEG